MSPTLAVALHDRRRWFLLLSAALGGWLILSIFIWPHSTMQTANSVIVGTLVLLFDALAVSSSPRARYVNVALGLWLFISAFALPRLSLTTAWNQLFVSLLLIASSLVVGIEPTAERVT
jgi:hypothetical protein